MVPVTVDQTLPVPAAHHLTLDADIVVVGAGVVGLATARALLHARPGLAVVVVDKEDRVAAHQSGRNSGVIHAGLYYRPDSDKARMVAAGRTALQQFADEHGIPWRRCGKLVVATRPGEIGPLHELRRRATAQGVETEVLARRRLGEREPHVDGVLGLWVPSTGVIDFRKVAGALVAEIRSRGGTVVLGQAVEAVVHRPDRLEITTSRDTITTRALVTCAGLHADRVAALAGAARPELRIAPFRGEYHQLVAERAFLVHGLVYPVPDARFPFLGVHLSRGVDDVVHAGPNAVLALAREGYRWTDRDRAGIREALGGPGATALARRYWRTGIAEMVRSSSRRALVTALRRLVPDLTGADLQAAPAGVRAQALRADGTLLDDFAFGAGDRVVSVLNAPSPAATACLEIGRVVATRALAALPGDSGPLAGP
jgi:L-2-hydroxyglutarate oxidase LhgO